MSGEQHAPTNKLSYSSAVFSTYHCMTVVSPRGLAAVRDIAQVFAGSAGLRFIGMAFGFLVGIQLARGMGASGYGAYGLALSLVSMLSIPAEFGVPQLVVREVAAAYAENGFAKIAQVLRWASRTVFLLSAVMLCIGGTGLALFHKRIDIEVSAALLTGFLLIVVVPMGNVFGAALRGLHRIVQGQVPEIVLRPAIFSGLLFCVSLTAPSGLTPTLAMSMQVLAAGCSLSLAFVMLRNALPRTQHERSAILQERRWLRSAFPMALTESMRALQGNLSTLALGAMVPPSVVGVFRVGTSTGLLLTMPITVSHIVSAPVISRLYTEGNREQLQRYVSLTTLASVAAVLLFSLPVFFFGDELMALVFGSDFRESSKVLLIMTIGTVIGASFGPGATILNMTGREKRVASSFAASMLLLFTSTPPLILTLGAEGAALANAFSFIAWSVAMWRYTRKDLGVDSSVFSLYLHLRGRQ